jgi:antibiotic biosynthesis monooxygenase (ABM) superfamily enzyme
MCPYPFAVSSVESADEAGPGSTSHSLCEGVPVNCAAAWWTLGQRALHHRRAKVTDTSGRHGGTTPASAVKCARRWSPPLRTLSAALISGAIIAGVSLLVVTLAVRALLGPELARSSLVLIAIGTMVMASVGGWFAQPVVARIFEPGGEP